MIELFTDSCNILVVIEGLHISLIFSTWQEKIKFILLIRTHCREPYEDRVRKCPRGPKFVMCIHTRHAGYLTTGQPAFLRGG